jgi:transposase
MACFPLFKLLRLPRSHVGAEGEHVGRAKFNVFAVRSEELIEDRPELMAVIRPLLAARKAIEEQVGDLDRKVLQLARHDMQVRSFMTVPGVGPVIRPNLQVR